jgi:hypothetical protein
MESAAEVHLTQGELRHLRSILNKVKYIGFAFGKGKPTAYKNVG